MLHLVTTLIAAAVSGPELLMSADALAATRDDVFVVDAGTADAFEKEHIPGAAHLDVGALSEERDGAKGLLKSVEDLTPLLEKAGIPMNQPVVVYSHMAEPGDIITATRLFWILDYVGYPDVRLLDGGLAKWKAAGHPVESGPATVPPITGLALTPDPAKITNLDYVLHVVAGGGNALYDCRTPEEFGGFSLPSTALKAGHIPGASNAPALDLLNPDGTFKPADELKHLFPDDAAAPIAYCNTGRSASVGFFALRLLGRDDAVLYDGSMTEYTRAPDAPVQSDAPKE